MGVTWFLLERALLAIGLVPRVGFGDLLAGHTQAIPGR
jgi:hypothetical protein